MTPQELTQRLSDIESILLKLMEKKPSMARRLWNWSKPNLAPFILGMIFGGVCVSATNHLPLTTNQAAQGGAAIPFSEWTQRSGSALPSPSSMPQDNSRMEWSGSLSRNISEPPLPASPIADDGQRNSQRSFRRIPVRMR